MEYIPLPHPSLKKNNFSLLVLKNRIKLNISLYCIVMVLKQAVTDVFTANLHTDFKILINRILWAVLFHSSSEV